VTDAGGAHLRLAGRPVKHHSTIWRASAGGSHCHADLARPTGGLGGRSQGCGIVA
jgi:hypothetical protein